MMNCDNCKVKQDLEISEKDLQAREKELQTTKQDLNTTKQEVNKLQKDLQRIKNGGLFRNKDGTISDRLVWIMMLLTTELAICIYWAFSSQPLPSYAKDLLLANVPVLMTLIGAQSYENVSDKKILNLKNNLDENSYERETKR